MFVRVPHPVVDYTSRFLGKELLLFQNCPMNILLWVPQILAARLYGASGTMKLFMFDKISAEVKSFGALPRQAWRVLGILELICTVEARVRRANEAMGGCEIPG